MKTMQVQYVERDVDLNEIKKIAIKSAKRVQMDREKRLQEAINNHESSYISRELENVSTYDLIRMIFQKIHDKSHR